MAAIPPPSTPATGPSTAYSVIVSTAFSFTIATTGIVLRFASRWLCRKRLEANDYLIIVAYIFKLGIDIGSVLLVEWGIGQDVWKVTPTLTKYLQVLYIGPFFYAGAIGFTKLSILALYWSAFPAPYIRYGVSILSAIVSAWTVAVIIVALVPCLPVARAWNPMLRGTCINYSQYYYGSQIPNIITDFAIFFLPLKAVWDLHLPTRQFIQMAGVLALALITCAFDIVRLVVLVNLNNGGNFTRNQVNLSVWTDIEPSIAILVACLPILRPLLRPRTFLKLRNESAADNDNTEYYLRDDMSSPTKADSDTKSGLEGYSEESPSRNL